MLNKDYLIVFQRYENIMKVLAPNRRQAIIWTKDNQF